MAISRGPIRRATRDRARSAALAALLAAAAFSACSHRRSDFDAPAPGVVVPVKPLPLSQLLVLEAAGTPPTDTTVTVTAGEQLSVVLRNGPPDNTVFAVVTFPPAAFRADSGAAVTVHVRPRPGVYGLDIETDRPVGGGTRINFKYARFFSAPADARRRYGTDVAYERALAVGRILPDGTVQLFLTTRPASDNLEADVPGAGSYIVAAPQ